MVWQERGLKLQVTNVDGSPHTQLSSGTVQFITEPGMDTEVDSFQQRLDLYDGLVKTQYGDNRTVTIFGDTTSEMLGIHVEDSRTNVTSAVLEIGIWDTSGLANDGWNRDIPDIDSWKKVSTVVSPEMIAISRGQSDPDNFGYTLAASVDGADYEAEKVSASKLRLHISPSQSYTIWIANPSRQNASNHDSVAAASRMIAAAKIDGYTSVLERSKKWWHDYWSQSFVQFSNKNEDADYLENNYYVSQYLLAGASQGKYPYQFMSGAYRWDGDQGKWGWGYWHFNERAVYDSVLASNHIELLDPYFNLYSDALGRIKSETLRYYGIDGAKVPETMKWDGIGNDKGGDYTERIYTAGADVAIKMYMRYRYTNDRKFLEQVAYPFMKEVAKFYQGMLTFDGKQYVLASSNARENFWNVRNSLPDLAAIQALFPMAIEAGGILDQDPGLREEWQRIVHQLAPLPKTSGEAGEVYLPCECAGETIHNFENPELENVYYGLTGIGYPDLQTAINTYNAKKNGLTIWSQEAVNAARLGLGDAAFSYMKNMQIRNQLHTNGLSDDGNGVFESNGLLMTAINESLLQSYNGIIRVFPALPSDETFTAKFTLLASGGFLVSSEREAGEIKYVGLKSQFGHRATVSNPWPNEQAQVRRVSDDKVVMTVSVGQAEFDTKAGETYVIERTSKPLSQFKFKQLTGIANEHMKSFPVNGGTVTRFLGKASMASITVYTERDYGGESALLAPGGYNSEKLQELGIAIGSISSIKVPKGIKVVAYSKDSYGGTAWKITDNSPNLADTGNDNAIVSLIIVGQ
jgi:alpha-L-fucosidase 2